VLTNRSIRFLFQVSTIASHAHPSTHTHAHAALVPAFRSFQSGIIYEPRDRHCRIRYGDRSCNRELVMRNSRCISLARIRHGDIRNGTPRPETQTCRANATPCAAGRNKTAVSNVRFQRERASRASSPYPVALSRDSQPVRRRHRRRPRRRRRRRRCRRRSQRWVHTTMTK